MALNTSDCWAGISSVPPVPSVWVAPQDAAAAEPDAQPGAPALAAVAQRLALAQAALRARRPAAALAVYQPDASPASAMAVAEWALATRRRVWESAAAEAAQRSCWIPE
jgi:hypothetical protein